MKGCYLFNNDATCDDEQLNNRCYNVQAWPAIRQSQFSSVRVCGKFGGQPFLNVTRPDTSGKCPDSTSPCLTTTSAEETVCYPAEDHDAKCPITDIRLVESSAESTYTALGYTAMAYNTTASLVYSKTVAQMPPTTRKVEYKPCKRPSEQSASPNQKYYAGELAKSGCNLEQVTGYVNDPRFEATGLHGNVYDVQNDNGVLPILANSLDYNYYVDPAIMAQAWPVLSWSRPTLGWSLDCEAAGNTRAKAFEASENQITPLEKVDTFRVLGIVGIVFFAISCVVHIAALCKNGGHWLMYVLGGPLPRIILLVTGAMTVTYAYECLEKNEANTAQI